jgi:hypothetical protein
MSRKAIIDDLVIKKTHNNDNLRHVIAQIAQDGERVGDLIDRAAAMGIGTRKQIRAAIYLGVKSKNALYRLEEPA